MNATLTIYPISADIRHEIEAVFESDMQYVCLLDLRQMGMWGIFRSLRSIKVGKLFLYVEDQQNRQALLPILQFVSIVVPAVKVYVLDGELKSTPVSIIDSFVSILAFAGSSVANRMIMPRIRFKVSRLLRDDRVKVKKTDSKRVFYLNANLWIGVKAGGSVGHISGVINALIKSGRHVFFGSVTGRMMVSNKVDYVELISPSNFGYPWEYNSYRFGLAVTRQLENIFSKEDIGCIYQRMSTANFSGVMLSRSTGLPLILEYNGSEAWASKNWGHGLREHKLAERIEELNLKHAHLIVTVSEVLRDELLTRGVESNRIVCYPNCIDPEIFDPDRFSQGDKDALRKRHGIAKDALVITFVGTFGQWHGADILAKAISAMLEQELEWVRRNKLHFLLVGDGFMMPAIREILGQHATGGYVTLTGLVPQHEAPGYLAASDILSSPHVPNADGSAFFGSPTKLFEYMAMGKAIVASDLDQIGKVLSKSLKASDLPERAVDPEPGSELAVLATPGDAEEHAAGIRFLVNNASWRKTLGENARREALKNYTWEHHVASILAGMAALP